MPMEKTKLYSLWRRYKRGFGSVESVEQTGANNIVRGAEYGVATRESRSGRGKAKQYRESALNS